MLSFFCEELEVGAAVLALIGHEVNDGPVIPFNKELRWGVLEGRHEQLRKLQKGTQRESRRSKVP